jgi:hypothetical protein
MNQITSFFGYEEDIDNLLPLSIDQQRITIQSISYQREDAWHWLYVACIRINGQELQLTTKSKIRLVGEWYIKADGEDPDPHTLLAALGLILNANEQLLMPFYSQSV